MTESSAAAEAVPSGHILNQHKETFAMGDDRDVRKHKRFDSQNLLEYVLVDSNGNPTGGGMGRTLNISEGGILLETTQEFDTDQVLWILIGVEEEMVEVEGAVNHVGKSDIENRYVAGIEFQNIDSKSRKALKEYLARFKQQKS